MYIVILTKQKQQQKCDTNRNREKVTNIQNL